MFNEKNFFQQFKNLLAIDSTTGQFREIQNYIVAETERMGYKYSLCHKGGVIADLGGEGNPLVVTAHFDDIGLMVRHINANGTLRVCAVGGLYPVYCVTENVRVYTRGGAVYTGSICRDPNSIHVTEEEIRTTIGDYTKNVCVVLDKPVKKFEDTKALGIDTGDIIALEPRFAYEGGYIKSRFIDDKSACAILLAMMEELKNSKLNRKVYFYFSAYEEIGHGTSYLPEGVKDILAIDIAPTGSEQNSDEQKVTIFAKDSRFPYHWEMTNEVKEVADNNNIDYVMDIFTPHYGTDDDTSLVAGHDVRHAAIGMGTANSHGYERTHIDGIANTYRLLWCYLHK